MTRKLVPLFGKIPFDFGDLAAYSSEEVSYVKGVDVVEYDEATLIVRAHSRSIDAYAEVGVDVYDSNPSAQDPSSDFLPSLPRMSATVTSGSTTALFTAASTGPLGPRFEIKVRGTRRVSGAPPPMNLSADLSADLLLTQSSRDVATVPVLTLRKLDFDAMSGPGSREEVLVKAVDVSGYTEATLLVRVHDLDIVSPCELYLHVYETSPSPDDPSVDFVGEDPVASVRIQDASAGDLLEATVCIPPGGHLRIVAEATKEYAVGEQSLDATLSADLLLRAGKKSHRAVRVQRGVADFGASADTTTVTITPVRSTTRAFARITGGHKSSGGPAAGTSSQRFVDDIGVTCLLTGIDTITLTRQSGGENVDYRVYWEVWEYVGPAGGPDEFIVRYNDEVTFSPFLTQASQVLSNITDGDACIPFITGQRCSDTGATWSTVGCTAKVTGYPYVGIVQLVLDRGAAGRKTTANVSVAVVEFTGSNWSIQRNIEHVFLYAATDETENITDVGDWSTAFIEAGHRDPAGTQAKYSFTVRPGSTTTTLRFRVRDTHGATMAPFTTAVAHVAQNDRLRVEHLDSITGGESQLPSSGSTPQSETVDVSAVEDTAKTAVIAYATAPEANYELPRLNWQYRLQGSSTLEFWRARCGNGVEDSHFAAQIIQFPDL